MYDFSEGHTDESTPTKRLASTTVSSDTTSGPRVLRWTVDRYVAAIAGGVFAPALRAELIDGQIIEKMPIGDLHAYLVDLFAALFMARQKSSYVVRVQGPIALDDSSRPEPDLLLLTPPLASYAQRSPRAYDVVLLVEVSDTSLAFDRSTKLALYARAGISEYWIVNAEASELERYTLPRADGTYAEKRVFGRTDTLEHEVLGAVVLEEVFPEPTA